MALLAMVAASPETAGGYDASGTFRTGAYVFSAEGGGQHDVASHPDETGLEVLNGGVRLSVLPFGPTGRGLVCGALEIGLEPFARGTSTRCGRTSLDWRQWAGTASSC